MIVLPARLGDAGYIGRNLREEDAREVWAATGRLPSRVVVESARASTLLYAVSPDYAAPPCAIFGVAPADWTSAGIAWMLCTPEIHRVSLEVLRLGPVWVNTLLKGFPDGLHCTADTRNHLHIRWCARLGFEEIGSEMRRGVKFVHLYKHV